MKHAIILIMSLYWDVLPSETWLFPQGRSRWREYPTAKEWLGGYYGNLHNKQCVSCEHNISLSVTFPCLISGLQKYVSALWTARTTILKHIHFYKPTHMQSPEVYAHLRSSRSISALSPETSLWTSGVENMWSHSGLMMLRKPRMKAAVCSLIWVCIRKWAIRCM